MSILKGCVASYLLAGVVVRLFWGPSVNKLFVAAALGAGIPLILAGLLRSRKSDGARQKPQRDTLAESLLDASNPMVLATAMDGSFTYLNPSAERILGTRSADLVGKSYMTEVFAPGEMERISQWLRKLHPSVGAGPSISPDPMRDCVNYVLQFPPSQLRGIDL